MSLPHLLVMDGRHFPSDAAPQDSIPARRCATHSPQRPGMLSSVNSLTPHPRMLFSLNLSTLLFFTHHPLTHTFQMSYYLCPVTYHALILFFFLSLINHSFYTPIMHSPTHLTSLCFLPEASNATLPQPLTSQFKIFPTHLFLISVTLHLLPTGLFYCSLPQPKTLPPSTHISSSITSETYDLEFPGASLSITSSLLASIILPFGLCP